MSQWGEGTAGECFRMLQRMKKLHRSQPWLDYYQLLDAIDEEHVSEAYGLLLLNIHDAAVTDLLQKMKQDHGYSIFRDIKVGTLIDAAATLVRRHR